MPAYALHPCISLFVASVLLSLDGGLKVHYWTIAGKSFTAERIANSLEAQKQEGAFTSQPSGALRTRPVPRPSITSRRPSLICSTRGIGITILRTRSEILLRIQGELSHTRALLRLSVSWVACVLTRTDVGAITVLAMHSSGISCQCCNQGVSKY